MNFFGFSSPSEPAADHDQSSAPPADAASYNDAMLEQQKFHALDELKRAGVPLKHHVSPYLQVDPSIFKQSQPEYIMPEGYENGRGRFEFALGHIGCAVGGGFMVGGFRGFSGELFNQDTRKLAWKPWFTRVLNASGKHGSGYAQMAGTAVFLYSAVEVALKSLRADDPVNSFVAGAVAGGLYRSPYGARAAAVGSAAGLALSTLWNVGSPERRERLRDMLNFS